jgi:hypothetical protein
MGVSLDTVAWNWIPSAECKVSSVRSEQHSVYSRWCRSVVALDSQMHKQNKDCVGKSVIDLPLRASWEPFAASNTKRTKVLQSSGTNNCCSAPSTICMSVVPSVLCALASEEFAIEGKAFSCWSVGEGQWLCDVSSNWFGFCVCESWVVALKGTTECEGVGEQGDKGDWRT